MKTKNILLATGIGLIAYVVWKNSKKTKTNVNDENAYLPKSSNLTISPISSNSPTYARNGIYLGYPTIMNLNKR
jgi:hypothetical protein